MLASRICHVGNVGSRWTRRLENEMTSKHCELMGKVVTVSFVLNRRTSARRDADGSYTRTWESSMLRSRRAGWIVGVRNLPTGKHFPGGFDSPGSLKVTGRVKAVLVCFWPDTKGVYVLEGAYSEGGVPVSPARYAWENLRPESKQRTQVEMKQIMSDAPRDKRGRWT